jgi:eukaryotic-like serine/threonine-protein kinase
MPARDKNQPLEIELAIGVRVGAYEVEAVRARLPHLTVHRARHVVTGRTVALDLLRPTATAPSLRELTRELAALNHLRHANVAEILETGELDDGRPYLVVEWVPGRSLQTLLDRRGPLPLHELMPIADEIGSALAAAHALGVVHGELHARNVCLVARGDVQTVKVVSFGMSRLSGTRLSPEQSRGQCDVRSDIFALGALLYQAVTGVRPHADPLPPSTLADVPSGFDEIVLRCLRANPARRYDNVESLMQELRSTVSGSELVAELFVSAFIDPLVDDVEAAALDDVERALALAQRWLEEQKSALVLGGAGAVVATARIPRELDAQRAARAGWVKLAGAVRDQIDARPRKHPSVRTRVNVRID